MIGTHNHLMSQEPITLDYSEWLEATGRKHSNFNGVLFARQVTNLGREQFEGLTEQGVCAVIGVKPRMAEQSWPPLMLKPGEQQSEYEKEIARPNTSEERLAIYALQRRMQQNMGPNGETGH